MTEATLERVSRSSTVFSSAAAQPYSDAIREDFVILAAIAADPERDGIDTMLDAVRTHSAEGLFRFAGYLDGRETPFINAETKTKNQRQILELLETAHAIDPDCPRTAYMLGWKLCLHGGEGRRGRALIETAARADFGPACDHLEQERDGYERNLTSLFSELHHVQQASIRAGFMPHPKISLSAQPL